MLSLIVFLLARVLGDPVAFMLPFDALPADVERVRLMLGFDRPLIVQYADYVGQLLGGDLGTSTRQKVPVTELILQRWVASLTLVGAGLAGAFTLSIVLGVLAAVFRGTPIDAAVRTIAVVGQSAPAFWIGIVLVQVFSVALELLPSGGQGGIHHLI